MPLIKCSVYCVCVCVCVCVCISCSVMSGQTLCDPMDCTCQPSLSMEFSKNTGVGCHSLLQGIFPTQGLNPGLLHCRQILYHPSHQGIGFLLLLFQEKDGKGG